MSERISISHTWLGISFCINCTVYSDFSPSSALCYKLINPSPETTSQISRAPKLVSPPFRTPTIHSHAIPSHTTTTCSRGTLLQSKKRFTGRRTTKNIKTKSTADRLQTTEQCVHPPHKTPNANYSYVPMAMGGVHNSYACHKKQL